MKSSPSMPRVRTNPLLACLSTVLILAFVTSPAVADEAPDRPSAALVGDQPAGAIERSIVTESDWSTPDVLPLDAVRKGQRGYGLSVFAGRERVRFEVEVIGVWRDNTPELSFLLTRLSGQDLERSGVLGGMSGSPVYIDDKLVGAVAFSFQFGLDPIAGITPIDAMRRLSEAAGGIHGGTVDSRLVPASAGVDSGRARPAITPPTLDALVRREVSPDLLDQFLGLLAPRSARAVSGFGDGRSALTWTAGGLAGTTLSRLESILGPVTAVPTSAGGLGGGLTAGTTNYIDYTDTLEPGDAVSLILMRGDMSLAAHGTVTDRRGDSIVAFGHPVFSLGPTRLPMASSEVITPIASVADSFKLSNTGGLVGVFDQDREAGAHGVLGERPTLVPVSVRLHGLEQREYHMELADSEMFKASLIAMATISAMTSGSYAGGFEGIDIEARFQFDDHDDVVLRQSFDGGRAVIEAGTQLLAFSAFMELNEMERVPVRGLEVDLHQVERPHVVDLVGVRTERQRVAPGEQVEIVLEMQPYRGERYEERIDVTLPADLDDGRYYLMIGDGTSMDVARDLIAPREVDTVEGALDRLRSLRPRTELHLVGLVGAPGLSVDGAVLPDLPPSVRGLYGRAGVGQALELLIVDDEMRPLKRPMNGIHRIDFEVRESVLRPSRG